MCRTNQINDGSKHELGPATSYQMSSEQERVHHRYHPPNHEAAKQEMTGKKATETAMMKAGKQENSGKLIAKSGPEPHWLHPPVALTPLLIQVSALYLVPRNGIVMGS